MDAIFGIIYDYWLYYGVQYDYCGEMRCTGGQTYRGIILETPEHQPEYAHLRMVALSERVDCMLKTQLEMKEIFNLLTSEIHRPSNTAPLRATSCDASGKAS